MQTALEQAANGWRQADERHLWEQAGAEAYAWRASLWAARQLQLPSRLQRELRSPIPVIRLRYGAKRSVVWPSAAMPKTATCCCKP